ncbi:hypothetical protein ACFL1U_01000 [Patescibacteria group bacterium]
MYWNSSKTLGVSIFTFLLLLILAILLYWRQDLWLNVLSPSSGGVQLEGIISGNTANLELRIESGSEPQFTQVIFYGPQDSCIEAYTLKADETKQLAADQPGWWRIIFDIPKDAAVSDRWRFGFVNPDSGEWIDEESIDVDSAAMEVYEGAFAFTEYIGSPGLPCAVVQIDESLEGTTEKLTVVIQAESQTEAKYTQAKFFAPGSLDLITKDVFASEAKLSEDKKTWTITFDLPENLNVEERWAFGFSNPNTGLWLWPDRLEIETDDVVLYNNNFAFTEYCECQ